LYWTSVSGLSSSGAGANGSAFSGCGVTNNAPANTMLAAANTIPVLDICMSATPLGGLLRKHILIFSDGKAKLGRSMAFRLRLML
jgi:hypothetical protein